FRQNFGGGVGQCHHKRTVCHFLQHFSFQHTACGQAHENVSVVDHISQLAGLGFFGEAGQFRHLMAGAAFVDHAINVGDPDVFFGQTHVYHQVQARQSGCTSTGGHHLDLLDVFTDHFQAVQERGCHTNGGTVLVVVKGGDVHAFTQLALNFKTLGGLDVFQVDATKGRLQTGNDIHQLVGIGFVDLDVEHVQASKLLEQNGLAFHHGLGGQGATIAQTQHSSPVGDHTHQIATAGVAEGILWVDNDFFTSGGHTGGIRQTQIALADQRLGGGNRYFAGNGE